MIKTTDEFIKSYNILSHSGIGVVLVHSREPQRTEHVLRTVALAEGVPFKAWDLVNGWRTLPDDPEGVVKKEKILDVYGALQKVDDVAGDGKAAWGAGIYLVHYPHWTLGKHPGMIQLLKQYSRDFAETDQRLVLVVPEGFSPPSELQHDLTMLDFPLPSKGELTKSLLDTIDASLPEEGDPKSVFTEELRSTLVGNVSGMTQFEAENTFARAIVTNKGNWPNSDFDAFNKVILDCKTDVVKRSEVLEMLDPVSFDEVGGLDILKGYIRQRTPAFSEAARAAGVDRPKGLLMIGSPGTGKSLCSKAIASELGLNLVNFDISKCFGGIVGETEARVAAALKQVEAMAPAVVQIDEIDKGLGGAQNSGGDSGVSKRLLGKILNHLQESTAPIYWVFTANRADDLDSALVRKGRIDEIFCVTMPNILERWEILKIHLAKRKQSIKDIKDIGLAVRGSEGYVGAEIEAAVKEAVLISFSEGKPVTGKLIDTVLKQSTPLGVAFKDDIDRMMEFAHNNARMTSTPCEDASTIPGAAGRGKPAPRRRRIQS